MIHLPDQIIPLNSWSVYKIEKFPAGSQKSHFGIIIFNDGCNLYLFYITSKVEKAKLIKRNDPEALVFLTVTDIEEILKVDSCIHCGKSDLKKLNISVFKEMYKEYKVKYCCKLNDCIIQKIKQGISKSKTYSEDEKLFFKDL